MAKDVGRTMTSVARRNALGRGYPVKGGPVYKDQPPARERGTVDSLNDAARRAQSAVGRGLSRIADRIGKKVPEVKTTGPPSTYVDRTRQERESGELNRGGIKRKGR